MATQLNSSTHQFSCPSCRALLQAVLKQALTSVQCGECFDVFDVQMPGSAPGGPGIAPVLLGDDGLPVAAPPVAPAPAVAPAAPTPALAEADGGGKRQRVEGEAEADGAGGQAVTAGDPNAAAGEAASVAATVLTDDDSAANLEASLQSCTAHRDRILQMLIEEPSNTNLVELRDQLTNAINQLQGTKNMVQRARTGAPGTGMPGGAAGDAGRAKSGHSSRKNKPQRCSVCGGIGHKSRTCSMAVQTSQQQPIAPVQWAGAPSGCIGHAGDPSQPPVYVPVPGGGYVLANGQGQPMAAAPGAAQMSSAMGGPVGQPMAWQGQPQPQMGMPQAAMPQPGMPPLAMSQPTGQPMYEQLAPAEGAPAPAVPMPAEALAVTAAIDGGAGAGAVVPEACLAPPQAEAGLALPETVPEPPAAEPALVPAQLTAE